ncbi:hypothetical protein DXD09_05630 [Ligilactobacillus ruminis]|uniref:Integrase catalytic domain-containing protein n=1 Tax=Ligilactobacillus ruminis TaxID=1623 RepID=A0A8B2Z875_9LACO|nr:hypothetical protein DXD09_05630 [Ligilactobacillus ruminis]
MRRNKQQGGEKGIRQKTIRELIDYFNRKRAYASKNGLTAEQFRNQAVSC